jgi:hypothetical protein
MILPHVCAFIVSLAMRRFLVHIRLNQQTVHQLVLQDPRRERSSQDLVRAGPTTLNTVRQKAAHISVAFYFCLFSDTIHCSAFKSSVCALVQSLLSPHEVALGILSARFSSKLGAGPDHPSRLLRKQRKHQLRLPGGPVPIFGLQRKRKTAKILPTPETQGTHSHAPLRSSPMTPEKTSPPTNSRDKRRQEETERNRVKQFRRWKPPSMALGFPLWTRLLASAHTLPLTDRRDVN